MRIGTALGFAALVSLVVTSGNGEARRRHPPAGRTPAATAAATSAGTGVGTTGVTALAVLPPLPAGWPTHLELGSADSPGGAAAMHAASNMAFRYQYLAGGVNTGNGWATWNTNGDFAKYYIQDSVANGITPVFSYYQIRQSSPGGTQYEPDGVYNNMQNSATMTSYYNDVKLFMQKAGAFPNNMAVLHFEPDLWGYMEQRSANDDATTVPAKVASTGLPELAGLPNNVSGFARAIDKLRDTYAPNVILAYHMSVWGTNSDILYSNPSDATVDALATRAGAFFNSLQGGFDISFTDQLDRDAGYKQVIDGNPNAWYDSEDYRRSARFIGKFVSLSQKRMVLWQIPLGNTKMRAQNNTWGHYQDNHVEWLLDEPARTHLAGFVSNGVVALLFGGGASGTTCACDGEGDGVTNPPAINGNTAMSLSADDDGGFFDQKVGAYYAAGTMPFAAAPPTATATPTRTLTPTPTPTATRTPTPTATRTPDVHLPANETIVAIP